MQSDDTIRESLSEETMLSDDTESSEDTEKSFSVEKRLRIRTIHHCVFADPPCLDKKLAFTIVRQFEIDTESSEDTERCSSEEASEDSDDTEKNFISEEAFENSLRIKRDRPIDIRTTHRNVYEDPPWLAKKLAFTIVRQEGQINDLTHKIKRGFHRGWVKETVECLEKLGEMLIADHRLGDLLRKDFLELLVQLLKHERNPKLQINAAIILQRLVIPPINKAVAVEIENIIPIVVNLLHSQEYLVRLEVIWLLHNLVHEIPKSVLEEALVPVTSFLINDSTGYVVLHASSKTLTITCQEQPDLSPEKLKLALSALMKIIKSDNLPILSSASWGLAHLCDGRKEMVVEDEYLDCLIERLLNLLNADSSVMIISALNALGSIVRWGSDNVIEAIIKKEDALDSLMCLLEEDDMYYVKQACWIISNITARKEEHIKAVIDCKLIDPLFDVVETYKLVDVKKEALWAISNAMCGVGPNQIECLRNSCSKVFWNELVHSFWDDKPLIFVTLEGLVNMKMAEVTCDGQPIDAVELQYIFKKIFRNDNVQNSDGKVEHELAFKFKGQRPHILPAA